MMGVSLDVIEESEGAAGAEAAFGRLASTFDTVFSSGSGEPSTSYYVLAGRVVCLRIVGRELACILELPFSHLRLPGRPATPVHLQIDLWDGTITGSRGHGRGPATPGEDSDTVVISPDSRFIVDEGPNLTLALDRQRHHLVGCIASRETLTLFERGRPLLHVLMVWLLDQGVQALHAGFVAKQGRGVLLGGPSGSGKSSVALACAEAGFQYLADDCMGIEQSGEGFVGHSLYCSAHATPEHLRRFPRLAPHAIPGRLASEDKSLLLLADFPGGSLGRTEPIAAVVLPKVTGSGGPRFRPATKREALLRLSPSTLCLLPGMEQRRRVLERLVRLVESVPAYWMELNGPVQQIPAVVDRVLEGKAS